MYFYYFSFFSWILYVIFAALLIGPLAVLWTKVLKLKLTNPAYGALVGAILIAPWIQELVIAYNFGQLCRTDAGIFINKKATVDGFYDDTRHWWRQLAESDYRFVESRDRAENTLWRVERDGNELRHFKIERPTARYHYRTRDDHTRVAYKVTKLEEVVVDSQTNEILARDTAYAREPYWFFVALASPLMICPAPGQHPLAKHGLIYKQTLLPSEAK